MARYSKVVKKKKNSKKRKFLPEPVQAFLARRIFDVLAFGFVGGGIFTLGALVSYDAADPSLNTARANEGTEINNWFGETGALIADLGVQTIGLATGVLAIVFIIWGIRLWKRRPMAPMLPKTAALLAAVIFGAMAFARLPSGDWLAHPYLGGSAGNLMLNGIADKISGISGTYEHMIVAGIAALLALAAFLYSVAVTREHAKDFVFMISRMLIKGAVMAFDMMLRFANWIRHYNNPDYDAHAFKRDRALKIGKEKKAKADKKADKEDKSLLQKITPPLTSKEQKPPFGMDEPAQVAAVKSSIKVVAPDKTTQNAKQSSMVLSGRISSDVQWELPPVDLLQDVPQEVEDLQLDETALRQNAELLQTTLSDFNVSGDIVSIHPGPVVTLYELEPSPGTKSARVIGLSDDIARSMSAVSVRTAVIPGRNVIGIELPNAKRQTVYFREVLETQAVAKTKAHLPLILGKDIGGKPVIADLAKMPHLLIAGTTGSGKSVGINTMVLSLLYQLPPEKCRLIMIDPKMLELSVYDDIPHLLAPVVTEPGKAVVSLKWAVAEMENRYRAMSKLGVRNIEGYNARLAEARKKNETLMRKVQTGFDPESGKPVFEDQQMDMTELPYIVIIVDEFADLMLVAGKDVENAVQRLAQMARAAGIHLIMATQRPSVDVITGVIKANFPTRISFQVTSKVDSRTILGEGGAEQLLGMGDMLYMAPGGRILRVHGPFVSDDEVEHVASFLKAQGEPQYLEEVTEGGEFGDSEVMSAMFGDEGASNEVDELYDKAVAVIAREGKASTSFIQRHLQIGYNRAARIIEEMERQGVVSKASPTGKRDVLVSDYSDA